jgi:hypothetical protein
MIKYVKKKKEPVLNLSLYHRLHKNLTLKLSNVT